MLRRVAQRAANQLLSLRTSACLFSEGRIAPVVQHSQVCHYMLLFCIYNYILQLALLTENTVLMHRRHSIQRLRASHLRRTATICSIPYAPSHEVTVSETVSETGLPNLWLT